MQRIRLTDILSLSRITAGMMRIISDDMSKTALEAFIDSALENGITSFDHAAVYGGELHRCEFAFGNVLKEKPSLRDKLQLVTKFGIYPFYRPDGVRSSYYDHSAEAIRQSVEDSLRALGTDHVELALVHRPSPFANPEVIGETASRLKEEGKIGALGVSNFTPAQMRALQKHFSGHLVVNQVELSPIASGCLFDGTLDYACENSSVLMAWSPLGGGKIFENIPLLEKLRELGIKYGVEPDSIAYAWVASHPASVVIVTGTVKWARMKTALAGCDLVLSAKEWFEVLEAARGFKVP